MTAAAFSALIQSPESRRDDAWELHFLDAMVNRRVTLDQAEPRTGPDGWPYMVVGTGASGTEPFVNIARWCSTRGIGIVVNAHKLVPDYVFTYGMLWNFCETGRFLGVGNGNEIGAEFVIRPGALVGDATKRYLPPYVRATLREFLAGQGFDDPRLLVVSSADLGDVDLCWVGNRFASLGERDRAALAGALAWFLPGHYRQAFIDGRGLPAAIPL